MLRAGDAALVAAQIDFRSAANRSFTRGGTSVECMCYLTMHQLMLLAAFGLLFSAQSAQGTSFGFLTRIRGYAYGRRYRRGRLPVPVVVGVADTEVAVRSFEARTTTFAPTGVRR